MLQPRRYSTPLGIKSPDQSVLLLKSGNQKTMHFSQLISLGVVGGLARLTSAQFPPKPEGITVLESKLEEGVRISYKEVRILSGNP
jgi:hypothetical protein